MPFRLALVLSRLRPGHYAGTLPWSSPNHLSSASSVTPSRVPRRGKPSSLLASCLRRRAVRFNGSAVARFVAQGYAGTGCGLDLVAFACCLHRQFICKRAAAICLPHRGWPPVPTVSEPCRHISDACGIALPVRPEGCSCWPYEKHLVSSIGAPVTRDYVYSVLNLASCT